MVEVHRHDARSNLPAEVSAFVGRRWELTETKRLLENHRLVTLTGPGGVGKTRLAVRAATPLVRAFPEGVYLADLTGLENGLLLADTLLQALGVVDRSARPAVHVLSEYVRDRRILLVLDNCEHLIDACTWLVDALLRAAPRLRVLATSREPLRVPGEGVLEVAPVPEADAVDLFAQRAGAVVAGFSVTGGNRDAVVELCRRLDGLPLAIELAAARLSALSVPQILDRLDDRFRLLSTPGRAGGRHGSMQATVEWSVQSCAKPERVLWARLSVFAGDFDLTAAEEVCSGGAVPREDVVDLVAGLVDKSILVARRAGPVVRYGWLETLREYGRRLLAECGDEPGPLRRRHRDRYRSLATSLWTDTDGVRQGAALATLLAGRDDVRAALEFCLTEPGEARYGLDLAATLQSYWLVSATLGEGRHWLERCLARDREPSPERCRALWAYGWLAIEQGDLDAARRRLAEARALADRTGDESGIAWTVALTGYAAMFAGDLERARPLLEEGLRRHRALGSMLGVYATMSGLAQTTSYLGDPHSAEISVGALAAAEEKGLATVRSMALRNLGLEMVRQGQVERATDLLRECLRAARRGSNRYGVATCLDFLGWAAEVGGDHDRAARLLAAARAAYQRIGGTMPRPQRERADRYAAAAREAAGEARFDAAYRAGGEMSEEQAVSCALGETSPAPPAPAAEPSPLTRRERQVAELVADGLSDKEIAAALVIARRTAETHVANILQKLGFGARSQIAAWVARHPPG
jgi:predicted ATPase/DNA-binding CsgD family transcriptional regulator